MPFSFIRLSIYKTNLFLFTSPSLSFSTLRSSYASLFPKPPFSYASLFYTSLYSTLLLLLPLFSYACYFLRLSLLPMHLYFLRLSPSHASLFPTPLSFLRLSLSYASPYYATIFPTLRFSLSSLFLSFHTLPSVHLLLIPPPPPLNIRKRFMRFI